MKNSFLFGFASICILLAIFIAYSHDVERLSKDTKTTKETTIEYNINYDGVRFEKCDSSFVVFLN